MTTVTGEAVMSKCEQQVINQSFVSQCKFISSFLYRTQLSFFACFIDIKGRCFFFKEDETCKA